jgi:hypothetical protein
VEHKLLEIFESVVLSWVYKMLDMKHSRRGGTEVILSSNGCGEDNRPLPLCNSVAPGSVKSYMPIATVIGPA